MTQNKKLHFNILYRIMAAAMVAVVMLGALSGTAAAVSDGVGTVASDIGCGVSAVSLNKRGDTVSVEIALTDDFVAQHKKQNVYLFALPYGSESLLGLSPITYFRATDRYIYRFPLTEGQLSGIYNGYVIALADENGYSPVGEVRYIPDLTPAALYDYDCPAVSSLKGLEVTGSLDDALALNLSHAVVEVDMAALLAGRAGADTLSYDFNGRTAHIVASELAQLDDRVRTLSLQGARVYLRLLPGDAYDSAAGLCSLLERRADEVGALLHLLATRYTDPDAPHGFAGSMIVGRDANLPAREDGISMTVSEYMTAYTRLCRMANAALTSVYSEGRVYIAPSNNLSSVPEGYDTSATSLQDFLSLFNEQTARGGDYLWGIAASAYAYSLSDTGIWDDALATGASTQLISPANIGVLTSLIYKNYNYQSTVRRPIIVGAFSVPGTGSETAEREQATSLAYAYYKILENGSVDALIWGEQTDPTASDAASRFAGHGLSVADLSGNILSHRQAWEVMSVIDTDCAGRLPALIDGIGQGGVVDYVYGTQSAAAQTKVYMTGGGSAILGREGLKLYSLLDFSTGSREDTELYGLGYAATPSLLADGASSSALELTSGATLACYSLKRSQLSGKHRLIVTLAQCTGSGTLVLTLSQGDARRYRAEVRIERGNSDISFDIKAFCSDLDRGDVTLTLSVRPDGSDGVYSLSELSCAKVTTAAPVVWVILFVILVTAAVVVILLMFNGGLHARRRRAARARRATEGRGGDGDGE